LIRDRDALVDKRETGRLAATAILEAILAAILYLALPKAIETIPSYSFGGKTFKQTQEVHSWVE